MLGRFLDYVEIKTKITSIFAFALSISYLFALGVHINSRLTWIFFAGMFLFDLTTTSINNYIDTKTNNLPLQFKRTSAKVIIFILLGTSIFFGLWLVILTDLVVLITGGLCFLIGIFYTYGPIPISRQPWGEIFSGILYGFFIPFLVLYINMPLGTYLSLTLGWDVVYFQANVLALVHLGLISIAPVCTTANIMLANNICDLERDIRVKRYTLPYYLGSKSLYLFASLYYITYFATIIMAVMGMISPIALVSLVTLIPVQKNISRFLKEQTKETTFNLSIKNYIWIMTGNILGFVLTGLVT
ncbi:MAG: UbiA family prenyltransferase [Anaerovoracaceae bacterium]|jgi:1,4-dihydroxy-2-naphthoate octaprenyltransferase|nr:UbiA family prenyltransferase [Anaerovoracaceae bacterium]